MDLHDEDMKFLADLGHIWLISGRIGLMGLQMAIFDQNLENDQIMAKIEIFSFFAHKSPKTIYIQILFYVSVEGPPGGHFDGTGARAHLTEAKSETSEKQAKNVEFWPIF